MEAVGTDRVSARKKVGQVVRRAKPIGTQGTLEIVNMKHFHDRYYIDKYTV